MWQTWPWAHGSNNYEIRHFFRDCSRSHDYVPVYQWYSPTACAKHKKAGTVEGIKFPTVVSRTHQGGAQLRKLNLQWYEAKPTRAGAAEGGRSELKLPLTLKSKAAAERAGFNGVEPVTHVPRGR